MAATWPPSPDPGWRCSCAVTPTCPTSAASPRPSGDLVFDVNDFDETLPGPFEWDVKRLAASLEVAARATGVRAQGSATDVAGSASRPLPAGDARVRRRCQPGHLVPRAWTWPASCADSGRRRLGAARPSADSSARLAKARDQGQPAGAGQADHGGGRAAPDRQRPAADRPGRGAVPRHVSRATVEDQLHEPCRAVPRDACRATGATCSSSTEFVELARKVVGVGSVGHAVLDRSCCWAATTADPCSSRSRRPRPRCSSAFARHGAQYANHGERVVAGQRLMQAASDIFLGWDGSKAPTASPGTSTCASCGTGRARSRSRP